jgi:hypothetical protein
MLVVDIVSKFGSEASIAATLSITSSIRKENA